MKKIAFMIVYNDVDYVDYAIRSIVDWVDEMIIVEGAFEITMAQGKPARSDDGTLEILKTHSVNPKITIIHANKREHKDHYDIGYQQACERGADWAIMIDSDEIWGRMNQSLAESWMNRVGPNIKEMRISEYCFINDFRTYYNGTYPRIFRCEPEAFFVFDNEVQFSEGRGRHDILSIPEIQMRVFHYGYVRRKKRWELKQDYMFEKDQNPVLENYKLEGNTYIIPNDIPIYKFIGRHLPIMQRHPFHNMTAEEIIYGK